MKRTSVSTRFPQVAVDLGENPVNKYQAREYAKESSPSILAVILELSENARDNATDIELTIEIDEARRESGWIIKPKRIICQDNGTGLSHDEFLERFCGAFSESDAHHEVDRAGRNGVGTKTYTSIAEKIRVETTTGRLTQGLDAHRDLLGRSLPNGLTLPRDGEPDTVRRVYEFLLHTRSALSHEWSEADPQEMGTRVELYDLRPGTEINFEILRERLSYAREWLHNPAHSFTLILSGNVPPELASQKRTTLRPWSIPVKNWLVEVSGRSDELITIYDPTTKNTETVPAAENLPGVIEFDFRVVGRNNDGQMQSLEKPALLLEVSGALPYGPNVEGVMSARTQPFLHFINMEHASSIGAFYNAVCGWARINSIELKDCLRNNKTTLASGPGAEPVVALQFYLYSIFRHIHRAWYNATRASQDEASQDALREAQEEVNLALKGVNRTPFKNGNILRGTNDEKPTNDPPPPPARRHRWECGSCERRWLAEAGFTPRVCAERFAGSGTGEGCGSQNIGLAKNQPRIADCDIRIEQLGDPKIPSVFQFDKASEDVDVPVVRVNLTSPRYIELRGTGSMSGQAQTRLKQYLVDVSLVAIAEYNSKIRGTDFSEEWGDLYFNRMLRLTGIKKYQTQLGKVLQGTTSGAEQQQLLNV